MYQPLFIAFECAALCADETILLLVLGSFVQLQFTTKYLYACIMKTIVSYPFCA